MGMTTWVLLARHGQTDWNRGETDPAGTVRFRGRADIPLSDAGQEEVSALAGRIAAEYSPVSIYSSPLRRASQTAEAIAAATNVPIYPVPGLADVDYGAWQGLTAAEAAARDPEAYRAWSAGSAAAAPPGGESLAEVGERAWQELRKITIPHPDAAVVAVSHDVVCALLLARALGLPPADFRRVAQGTASLSLLAHGEHGWEVRFRNDRRHLRRLA